MYGTLASLPSFAKGLYTYLVSGHKTAMAEPMDATQQALEILDVQPIEPLPWVRECRDLAEINERLYARAPFESLMDREEPSASQYSEDESKDPTHLKRARVVQGRFTYHVLRWSLPLVRYGVTRPYVVLNLGEVEQYDKYFPELRSALWYAQHRLRMTGEKVPVMSCLTVSDGGHAIIFLSIPIGIDEWCTVFIDTSMETYSDPVRNRVALDMTIENWIGQQLATLGVRHWTRLIAANFQGRYGTCVTASFVTALEFVQATDAQRLRALENLHGRLVYATQSKKPLVRTRTTRLAELAALWDSVFTRSFAKVPRAIWFTIEAPSVHPDVREELEQKFIDIRCNRSEAMRELCTRTEFVRSVRTWLETDSYLALHTL